MRYMFTRLPVVANPTPEVVFFFCALELVRVHPVLLYLEEDAQG